MDGTIDEKRVYADRAGADEVLVAAEQGLVVVSLSEDRVGEFGLEYRGTVRDVAATGDRLALATDSDVLVGDDEPTDFGPAVAVGFHDGTLLAAGPDGRVARLDDGWTTLGGVETPRAIDGGMIAAESGVHQVVGDDVRSVGLGGVHDVYGRGMPLAATDDGLYRLGNGWMDELDGAFDVVSADGAEPRSASSRPATDDGADDRAHAVGDGTLFAREAVGEWAAVDVPTDSPVDVAYTDAATVAVTTGGTFLADAGDGWRTRELGVTGVAALAVRA